MRKGKGKDGKQAPRTSLPLWMMLEALLKTCTQKVETIALHPQPHCLSHAAAVCLTMGELYKVVEVGDTVQGGGEPKKNMGSTS